MEAIVLLIVFVILFTIGMSANVYLQFLKEANERTAARPSNEYDDDELSWEAWHTTGLNQCGNLAFSLIEHPSRNRSSSNVILPDGTHPPFCSRISCGTCKQLLQYKPELRRIPRIRTGELTHAA
jgi:hypothetical protein